MSRRLKNVVDELAFHVEGSDAVVANHCLMFQHFNENDEDHIIYVGPLRLAPAPRLDGIRILVNPADLDVMKQLGYLTREH